LIFSSNIFLYVFLLPVLATHTVFLLLQKRLAVAPNIILLISSLAIYYWGNGSALVALASTVGLTYIAALLILSTSRFAFPLLFLGISFNLALLFYYKYYSFFVYNFLPNDLVVQIASSGSVDALPVGISFYTFMTISYLLEVYKRTVVPAGPLAFSTYLTMFPHLIAGPIVRYSEIQSSIQKRHLDTEVIFDAITRFSIGFAKKVILATPLGEVADTIFALPTDQLPTELAWVGALCYTFQIYFDFSGYSDMAIGLALLFGFRFPENFNNPYRAQSLTEFWRRWHMTLTRWFRDYVYIPLGGNRRGTVRTLFNLFCVFLLCGLWHGAAWTFVVWGIFHGFLLVFERVLDQKFSIRPSGLFGSVLTFLLIIVGWVLFRASSLDHAVAYLEAMAFLRDGAAPFASSFYISRSTVVSLVLAVLFTFVPVERLIRFSNPLTSCVFKGAGAIVMIALSMALLADSTYSPFIYFRF
jgi:alginate O-acetyltransferase complex protein AlgI